MASVYLCATSGSAAGPDPGQTGGFFVGEDFIGCGETLYAVLRSMEVHVRPCSCEVLRHGLSPVLHSTPTIC